ncbi:hypothetical protein ALP72_200045 [Pseudomonas coronafaciens pv. coronafaciens]|nr:hypothetical protein ALP72_200045 [Pseudomonas coronafaciens pv. coronafaciens]
MNSERTSSLDVILGAHEARNAFALFWPIDAFGPNAAAPRSMALSNKGIWMSALTSSSTRSDELAPDISCAFSTVKAPLNSSSAFSISRRGRISSWTPAMLAACGGNAWSACAKASSACTTGLSETRLPESLRTDPICTGSGCDGGRECARELSNGLSKPLPSTASCERTRLIPRWVRSLKAEDAEPCAGGGLGTSKDMDLEEPCKWALTMSYSD